MEVDSRRAGAEGVQIHLVACDPPARLAKHGVAHQRDFRIPLRWAFSHETSVDLPPGISRYVDILEISSLDPRLGRLTTLPAPPEGHFLIHPPERYRLRLAVVARDVAPSAVVLAIRHQGDWNGSEATLGDALSVKKKAA